MAESATAFRLLARLLAAHDAFLDEQSRLNADAMKDAADDARAYVTEHAAARVAPTMQTTASCFLHGDFDPSLKRCPECAAANTEEK